MTTDVAVIPPTDESCPFCHLSPERILYQGNLLVGIWDAKPKSPGHTLLVTRRHIENVFGAEGAELQEVWHALACIRATIEGRFHPDGFNIGTNVGRAAGQRVYHFHIHVIPRYEKRALDLSLGY